MVRIHFTLATLSLVLMVAALLLGLTMGDLNPEAEPEVLQWATVHRLTGVAAALAVVFVNSVVVTYFIGTSRWSKEVVETYTLDPSLVQASTRLKRRTFPWALAAILAAIGVSALGAASDPATGRIGTENWRVFHFWGACAGIAFIGWSSFVAWNHIHENHRVIREIVAEVHRIRQARGLEVGDSARR